MNKKARKIKNDIKQAIEQFPVQQKKTKSGKQKSLIISSFTIIIISTILAVKATNIFDFIIDFFRKQKLPLDTVYLFNTYRIVFPEYFFLNLLIIFIFSFILIYLFDKKSGRLKSSGLNPSYIFFIGIVILLHLIVIGYYLSNKNGLIQAIIFLIEILLLLGFFIYLDKKENKKILYSDILTKNEFYKLLLFSFVVFMLYAFDQYSWKYSYIGDEYSFYEVAKSILNGTRKINIFSENGVYGFNPELSSIYQAIVMLFFSPDKFFGWKLSSALIVVFSIIPFYIWIKTIFNKSVAIITVIAFAFCHTMLAFGHIGYNNIQVVFPFIAGLCCFELAIRKNSSFYSFLTALIVGLGCYNYYFTRLLLVFLPFYWFVHPLRKNFLKRNIIIIIGVLLAIIMFIIINPHWIGPVMQRSFIKGSEIPNPQERPIYIILNFIYTLLIFIYKGRDSHFVVGGMTDFLTTIGILFGIIWALWGITKDWRAKFLIFAYVLTAFATGAISMYNYPANTRIQTMVPLFAILAGIGLTRMAALSVYFKNSFKLYKRLLLIICVLIIIFNLYGFYIRMPKKFQFTMQSYIIKVMQKMTGNKKCVLVSNGLSNIYELANFYKFAGRFEVISSQTFEYMVNTDELKGKVLIVPFDSIGLKPEIANFVKDGQYVLDFTERMKLIYIYDFTDEKYYRAFKELWFTGRTDYVIQRKEIKNYKIKIPEFIKKKNKTQEIKRQEQRTDLPLIHIAEGFFGCGNEYVPDSLQLLDYKLSKIKLNTKFKYPSDIAVSSDGEYLYIADSFSDCFFIFKKIRDFEFKVINKVLLKKKDLQDLIVSAEEEKNKEIYIYLKYNFLDNNLYVYEANYGIIKVYDKKGNLIKTFVDSPFLNGGRSLSISNDGKKIAVSMPGRNAIAFFDTEGKLIKNYSTSFGNMCGQLSQPCFFTLDLNNNFYVVDAANFRVQILTDEMKYKKHFIIGNVSTILGPQIIIFEEKTVPHFVLTQPYNKQLLFFTMDGKKSRIIELKGQGFENPGPITKDNNGNIYILDTTNKITAILNVSDEIFK